MNRMTVGLATVCVVLLGGAFLASRALTADIAAPPSARVEPSAPPVVAPPPPTVVPAPSPVAIAPPTEPTTAPVAQVNPAQPPRPVPSLVPPPPRVMQPAPPPPPPDLSPGESELFNLAQQGEQELATPADRAGPGTWRRAEKAFERCLFLAPGDQRCQLGIEEARRRLASRPGATKVRGALPPPVNNEPEEP